MAGQRTLTPCVVVRLYLGQFYNNNALYEREKELSKKTHWKSIADNDLASFEDPSVSESRKKRMFKWGLAIDRMPYNKPKFNKVKKLDVPEED